MDILSSQPRDSAAVMRQDSANAHGHPFHLCHDPHLLRLSKTLSPAMTSKPHRLTMSAADHRLRPLTRRDPRVDNFLWPSFLGDDPKDQGQEVTHVCTVLMSSMN